MTGQGGDGDLDRDAAQRVTDLLVAAGVPAEVVADAIEDGVVHLLVAEHVVQPEPPRHTALDVARIADLPIASLDRLWQAMGFPFVPHDAVAFTDADVEAVVGVGALLQVGVVDLEEVVQLTRVVGSSMARIAEAEVAATPTLRAEGRESLVAADLLAETGGFTLPLMATTIDYVWRRHLQAALRRAAHLRAGLDGQATPGVVEVTVGFADLVGFTAQAQQLSQAALARLVARFEAISHEIVVSHGGRVVKMIGDEVLFAVDDAAAAVDVGLALAEAYAHDDLLSDVRVGVATGSVLARDGDVYGATVNLAHRTVKVARPGSVVVSSATREALEGDERFSWRPIRGRWLKDIGRVNLFVARRRRPGELALAERARRLGQERLRTLVPDAARERFEAAVDHRR